MKVSLTAQQVTQLQPYFDRVRAAAKMGTPGMLVAQLSWYEGRYWMTPAFLEHAEAKLVTQRGKDLPKLEKLRESPDNGGANER